MSLIRLDGVSYRYPLAQQDACREISMEIHPGRILGLLGENGAGKSTLAALIQGQLQAESGRISGQALHSVGLVHQKPSIIAEMPLWKTIIAGLPANKGFFHPARIQKKLLVLCREYGLDLDIQRPQHQLSQGEAQMGELLEVLYNDPQLILLDEPDFCRPEELEHLLKKLSTVGKGILLITHRLEQARSLCDEIIYLREGRRIDHPQSESILQEPVIHKRAESEDSADLLDLSKLFPKAGNLTLRRGERLVFLGFRESGLRELEEKLLTLLRGQRFAYIPSDSQTRALDFRLSISDNIHLQHQSWRKGWRSPSVLAEESRNFLEKGDWQVPPDQPLFVLSGGNRQKLLLKREGNQPYPVLLTVHPSLGLDHKNHREYLQSLIEMKDKGILYLTSDPREARETATTLLVLFQGEVHALYREDFPAEEDLQQIMMGAQS